MDQQIAQLSGKTVLIIGAAGIGRRFVWKTLHDLKLKVILVDTEDKLYTKDYIHSLVKYNYMEGSITDDDSHAYTIIQLLGDKVKELSACITYDEYCIHLTALLCQKLGFLGTTPSVALKVKSKKNTYDAISCGDFNDSTSTLEILPPLSFRIQTEEDILNVKGLSYPMILKPEHGDFAMGVTEVSSEAETIAQFQKLQQSFGIDWFGAKYGNSMVLMDFLQGVLYQVDLIMFHGDLIKGIINVMGPKFRDLGPTFPRVFADTTTCFSSCLPQKIENELIEASYRCCKNIGLNHGVYNMELVLTNTGYRLVEINGRPGSYRRCSVLKVTHGIDYWITQALISCGIKPILPESQRCFAVGCYLYSFIHKTALSKRKIAEKIHALCENNDILYIKRTEEFSEKEDAYPKPFAHLVALDERSANAAKMKLIEICRELELSSEDFDIEKMTELFG